MTTLEELVSNPPELPVTRALGAIAEATRPGGCAVVTAPPGTGKTTLLPPAVAVALTEHEASAGRVLVTQPRRVAAASVGAVFSVVILLPVYSAAPSSSASSPSY